MSAALPPAGRLQRLAPRAGRDGAPRPAGRRAAVRRRGAGDRAVGAVAGRGAARPRWLAAARAARAGVLACLVTALQPTIELRQVTRLPNRVAVLVDASRSMEVRPPDGGPSRAERAAALLERAAPRLAAWQQAGHEVDLYSFGENVSPATAALAARAARRRRDPHRRGAGRRARALRRARSGRGGRRSPTASTPAASARGRSTPTTRGDHRGAGRAGPHRRPRREIAARSVGRRGARRPVRVRAHAGQHRGGHPPDRPARPAGRGHAGARRAPDRHPQRRAARRSLRGEDLVRLAARSPGQLRVPHLDAGAARARR